MNAPASTSWGDASAFPADAIEVGRVVGAWGIKGGIKVKPFAADPQALFSSKRWFIRPPEAAVGPAAAAVALPPLLKIVSAKDHGDGVVATAQELPDRNAAEAMKGARIFISRASFPTPEPDEFYWVDLIGADVFNRGDAMLGTVVGLIETGPHCVLRVQPAAAEADELLIPFVDAYIVQVDLPARRLVMDWEVDD